MADVLWCDVQDFGNTWKNLTENSGGRIASFVDYDWGAYLKPWNPEAKEQPSDETIFATAYEDPKHMKVTCSLLMSMCMDFMWRCGGSTDQITM